MSNRIIEFVKSHPYGTALGVATVLALYVIFGRGQAQTSDGSVNAAYLSSQAAQVQAGQQFQVAQLQANQAALESNNKAAVANNQIDAATIIAQLNSNNTLAGIDATKAVNLAQISASNTTAQQGNTLEAQTTQAISLLQAQVAQAQIAAGTKQTEINAKAYVDIASLPYTAVTPAILKSITDLTSSVSALQSSTALSASDLAKLKLTTATAITDINNWSNKYQGGTIVPVSNYGGVVVPGGYNNPISF